MEKQYKSRAYFFCNMHLSPIQCGIQAAHVVAEFGAKYGIRGDSTSTLTQWAKHDKTIIVLNGGTNDKMLSIEKLLSDSIFPSASFRESEESLGGLLTCTGVILPAYMSEAIAIYKEQKWDSDTKINEGVKRVLSTTPPIDSAKTIGRNMRIRELICNSQLVR